MEPYADTFSLLETQGHVHDHPAEPVLASLGQPRRSEQRQLFTSMAWKGESSDTLAPLHSGTRKLIVQNTKDQMKLVEADLD